MTFSFIVNSHRPQMTEEKFKTNLNKWVEKDNDSRCSHKGALHETIKQLTVNQALWHTSKNWTGPLHSDFVSRWSGERFKCLWKRVYCWGPDGRSLTHNDCSMTKVTSAFRQMGKTSVNRAVICGGKCTFRLWRLCISVIYRKNQRSNSSSNWKHEELQ